MNDLLSLDGYSVYSMNGLKPLGQRGLDGTARNLVSGRGVWLGYLLHNNDSAARWVQVFFKPASEVTPGTTAPDVTILIGASTSIAWDFYRPIRYERGLSALGTTTETGSTGPTNAVTGSILYKAQ